MTTPSQNNPVDGEKKESGYYHPCTCRAYNGGQCYNCLNGAHDICTPQRGQHKCNRYKRPSKKLGLTLVFK